MTSDDNPRDVRPWYVRFADDHNGWRVVVKTLTVGSLAGFGLWQGVYHLCLAQGMLPFLAEAWAVISIVALGAVIAVVNMIVARMTASYRARHREEP